MRKIILTLMIGIFLLAGVTALDSMGTYKQYDTVRLCQICDDATFINVSSVTYPNSSVAVSQVNMTPYGSGEFCILFTNTSVLGRYHVRGISDGCSESGNNFATYFDITPTGDDRNFGFFLILVIAAMIVFIGGYVLDQDWALFLSGILWIVTGIYTMIYGIGDLTDLYTRSIAGVSWAIGVVLMSAGIINSWGGSSSSEDN